MNCVYFNRQLINIFWVGLICGVPFLLNTEILDMRLKTAGISNTVIGILAILHCPYTFKFLLGPFADKIEFPYFCRKFGQRRGWALVSQILLFIGLVGIGLSNPASELEHLMLFVLLSAFASGLQDITMYSYQFDNIQRENFGVIASVVNIGYKTGMLISKSASLYIQYYFGWTATYLTMALSVVLSVIFVLNTHEPVILVTKEEKAVKKLTGMLFEKEKKRHKETNILSKLKLIFFECLLCPTKIFMKSKNWTLYVGVIMLYKIGDIMLRKMAKIFYIDIGFSILQIANIVQVFGTITSFIGGLIIGTILKRNDLKQCMLWAAIVHSLMGFVMLTLVYNGSNESYLYLVIICEMLTGSAMSTCFLAFLYSLCKTGSPTTQYALLWAAHNVVGIFIRLFSGLYSDIVGWKVFFSTIPLTFIPGIVILCILIRREKNDQNRTT